MISEFLYKHMCKTVTPTFPLSQLAQLVSYIQSEEQCTLKVHKNENFFGFETQNLFSFCVVLGLRGKIVPPPIMAQSKFFFGKILIV